MTDTPTPDRAMTVRIAPERRPNDYRLTAPQVRAMRLLRWCTVTGAAVSESNRTTRAGQPAPHFVYWQLRAWAERNDFIEVRYRAGRGWLYLTPLGREVADAVHAKLYPHQRAPSAVADDQGQNP